MPVITYANAILFSNSTLGYDAKLRNKNDFLIWTYVFSKIMFLSKMFSYYEN